MGIAPSARCEWDISSRLQRAPGSLCTSLLVEGIPVMYSTTYLCSFGPRTLRAALGRLKSSLGLKFSGKVPLAPRGLAGAALGARLLTQAGLGSDTPLGVGLPRGPWDNSPRSHDVLPRRFSVTSGLSGLEFLAGFLGIGAVICRSRGTLVQLTLMRRWT